MASEPTEGIQVELPTELEEWLRGRATELDVDPQNVIVQLLSTYRASDAMGDGGLEGIEIAVSDDDLEEVVEPAVRAAVADAVDASVDEEVESGLATALEGKLETLVSEAVETELDGQESWMPADSKASTDDLEAELDERLEAARADFHEKLEDVRERVIQVKREVDAKAPADHEHEALDRLDALEERVGELEATTGELEATIADLEGELESIRGEFEAAADDAGTVDEQFADLEERLTTVAWVVSDLREAHESDTGEAALQQLKREAAAADVSRAKCENCDEGVEVGLLTEPACPHCDATVTTVEPSQGFFGSPRLLVAAQLESGEER